MPRIVPATAPFEPSVQQQLDKIMPPGMAPFAIFTTMARDPRLFAKMVGKALFGKGHISAREREIVVGRVTARCGAEYEWGVHIGVFAETLGFTEEQIAALVHGDASDPCWSAQDARLIRLSDSLLASYDIDDALWTELKACYSDEAMIELIMLVGTYTGGSMMVKALRLEPEPIGRAFPPKPETRG